MSKRWEVTTARSAYEGTFLHEINKLGGDGWELVSITINGYGEYVAYLKREVSNG